MSNFGVHRMTYNVGPTSSYTPPMLPGPGIYTPPTLPAQMQYPTMVGPFNGASVTPGVLSLLASAALIGGIVLIIKKF